MVLRVRRFLLPSGGKGFIPCRVEDILREIDAALERLGLSARAASIRAQGAPEMIRDMRRGHVPSVGRLRSLCEVLDLEFHVGPRRVRVDERAGAPDVLLSTLERTAQDLARLTADAGGNPVSDDLWPVLAARRALASPPAGSESTMVDRRYFGMTQPIDAVLESALDSAWSSWVEQGRISIDGVSPQVRDLDLTSIRSFEIRDRHMEPTIPKGCTVLVDGARIDWEPPRVMAVCIDDDVIARRAALDDDGQRLLASNDPDRPDVPLPAGTRILGEVRWVLKSLSRATSADDLAGAAPVRTSSQAKAKPAG